MASLAFNGGHEACGSACKVQLHLLLTPNTLVYVYPRSEFAASSPDSTIIQYINGHRLLSSNGPLRLHGLYWAMARGQRRRRHRRVTRSTNVKQRRRASDSYCLRSAPSILVDFVNSRHHSDMPEMAHYQLTSQTEHTHAQLSTCFLVLY